MSHPQPPDGPHDPYQPNPQQPGDPWAPPPAQPAPGTAPDVNWGASPQPGPGNPWGAPQAAQPPVSGAPQPGEPQPPISGTPYAPYQAGGGYPPAGTYPPPGGPYPPGGGYPPSGPYPPGGPGAPLGPPQPTGGGGGRTVLIVVIVVAVVALLCCVGGIAALVVGMNQAPDRVSEALPSPTTTYAPLPTPATSAPAQSTPTRPAPTGETFNMKAGDTLVITDNDGTVEITVAKFRTVTDACQTYAPKPQKGRYLIAEVTATVTKGTGSINPFYFEWVADDGTTVNGLVGALAGCGDPLGAGNNLRTGSKRSGTVVFDVADTKGTLEYQHLFETAGSWKP